MFGKIFSKMMKKGEEEDSSAVSTGFYSEMNYCPVCGDEYRADRTKCAACDIALITGTEQLVRIKEKEQLLAGRSMDISTDDELVTLRKGALKDVKHLQGLLVKERIPSILAGDEQSCGKGCCGAEMYLQIRKNDVKPAMAVLNQEFIKSTALSGHDMTNMDAVYVQGAESTICPACGSQFSPAEEDNCPECGLCLVP